MSDFYQGPQHGPSLLTIDLAALRANYKILQKQTLGKPVSAVVKADGYGLGAVHVSKALAQAGCKTFFTAHLDEALIVRDALPDVEIGVLNGLGVNEESLYKLYNLLPTLNDLGQITAWQSYCAENGALPASIHMDTGMARLGLPPVEVKILRAEPERLDGFDFKYLMSHMACADTPDHPLNRLQQQRFLELTRQFPQACAMLAASSATFLGPDWHFDMVRTGVALYGGTPNSEMPNPMKQVVRLGGKILQIREIDAATPVGYGSSYVADKKTRVATVAVGYADGYLRSLSGATVAYFGDKQVPVLGRVSMDLLTLDISDVPKATLGSMIDLIGPNNDINKLAEDAGTVSYEILTSLSSRYKRHYVDGAERYQEN